MKKKRKSNKIWYFLFAIIMFVAAGWYILFDALESHIICNIGKLKDKCEIATSSLIKKEAVVIPAKEIKGIISQKYYPRDKEGLRLESEHYRIFIETEKNGIIHFGAKYDIDRTIERRLVSQIQELVKNKGTIPVEYYIDKYITSYIIGGILLVLGIILLISGILAKPK